MEIAANRAETSLSYSGKFSSAWADGNNYPDNYVRWTPFAVLATQIDLPQRTCRPASFRPTVNPTHFSIVASPTHDLVFQCTPRTNLWQPALHLPFLIRYVNLHLECWDLPEFSFLQSDIKKVTPENLVVFTVKYQYVLLKHRGRAFF